MTNATLSDRLLACADECAKCAPELREAAAALSAPEGDMARALEWLRGFGWVVPDTVKSAIEEAIAAYDPSAGAATGIMVEVDGVRFAVPPSVAQKVCAALAPCDNMPLSGREAVAVCCLVTEKRYPHFAEVQMQLYGGYEPSIGDRYFAIHKTDEAP